MAVFHCNVGNVKRASGKSSVGKAAYNAREKLEDKRTGTNYDYSRRTDIGHSEIIAPVFAPDWVYDRQELWNKVELADRRKDSRVAKEILVALPRELDRERQIALLRNFVEKELIPLGVVADLNCHELDIAQADSPDNWNPHAHILISTRKLDGDDFGLKISELNQKDFVVSVRQSWEQNVNEALAMAGESARIDGRSWADKGIDRIPQIHLGAAAIAMMRRGIATSLGEVYQEIEQLNSMYLEQNQNPSDSRTHPSKPPLDTAPTPHNQETPILNPSSIGLSELKSSQNQYSSRTHPAPIVEMAVEAKKDEVESNNLDKELADALGRVRHRLKQLMENLIRDDPFFPYQFYDSGERITITNMANRHETVFCASVVDGKWQVDKSSLDEQSKKEWMNAAVSLARRYPTPDHLKEAQQPSKGLEWEL